MPSELVEGVLVARVHAHCGRRGRARSCAAAGRAAPSRAPARAKCVRSRWPPSSQNVSCMSRAGWSGVDVECVEIVILGLHLGAIEHGESERAEQAFELALDARDRMQVAAARSGRGKREVEPFGIQTHEARRHRKCRWRNSNARLEALLGVVEGHARRASSLRAQACPRPLLNPASAPCGRRVPRRDGFQFVLRLSGLDARKRTGQQVLYGLLEHVGWK